MKLIKPSYEILTPTDWRMYGVKKFIELVGRTCYKSEDKITPDSYERFVEAMINSKHYSMLEHGTLYLEVPDTFNNRDFIDKYLNNPYSYVNFANFKAYITTNFRVIIENNWINDIKYIIGPTEYHELRITVKFVCNRQVSHEFVRHRVFSFAQESTRYCNYTKGKFGGELTFIQPCWIDEEYVPGECNRSMQFLMLTEMLENVETTYYFMINNGWKPQQAATVLPNALKTELVMTGFVEDWKHFFDLRALDKTGPAHPQAKELALPLYNEFIKRGYINE